MWVRQFKNRKGEKRLNAKNRSHAVLCKTEDVPI